MIIRIDTTDSAVSAILVQARSTRSRIFRNQIFVNKSHIRMKFQKWDINQNAYSKYLTLAKSRTMDSL